MGIVLRQSRSVINPTVSLGNDTATDYQGCILTAIGGVVELGAEPGSQLALRLWVK